MSGVWQDGSSGYYDPYAASTYPLTTRSESAISYAPSYAPPSTQSYVPPSSQNYDQSSIQSHNTAYGPPARAPTEEDMVGQQMASLLNKSDRTPSPNANQETFQLKWPPSEDEDDDAAKRHRARTLSVGALHLSPGDARRHGRNRSESGGALGRIGQAIGLDERGRAARKQQKEKEERRRSRDERRRQIELGHLSV